MSPDFLTQVVVEQPQIVIFSSNQVKAAPLVAALTSWQLEVIVVSPHLAPQTLFDQAYKIVWLVDPTEVAELITHQAVLAKNQTKTTFLLSIVTPIMTEGPALNFWLAATHQQKQVLETITTLFDQAKLVVGQDVLPDNTQDFPVFKVMTQALAKRVILDPTSTLFMQTWESFCQSAASLIISPNRDTYLIQGKKTTTTTLAKMLQLHLQRLTQELLTLEPIVADESLILLNEAIIKPTTTALEIDGVMREVSLQVVRQLSAQTPPPTPAPILPQPIKQKSPVIVPSLHSKLNKNVASPTLSPVKKTTIPKLVIPYISPTLTQPLEKTAKKPPKEVVSQEQIEDEVVRLFQDYRTEHKIVRVREVAQTTVKTTKKLVHKKKAFVGGVVFVGLGLLVVSLVAFFFVSTWQLKRSFVATLGQSIGSLPNSETLFWAKLVTWQINAYTHVIDPNYFSTSSSVAELTASLPLIQQQLVELDKLAEIGFLQALGRKEGEIQSVLSQINSLSQTLYESLSENQAKLKTFPTEDLTEAQQTVLSEYEISIAQAKKTLLPTQQLQPLLAALLGKKTKQTYAVILQNNQELRPTGGFVQAVGLLTFDQGMLIDTQVFNAYELDSRSTGVVAPPQEITQLLGEKQLFLRDSNWHPDFPTSAKQMSFFIERSTGKKIDGVIGLNLLVARNLLKALGPVELPEYNEIITDKNLAERMEFHSEIQLVPSATQPDYATLFLTRLVQKITQVQPEKIPGLLTAIRDSFEQKQLLISFQDLSELSAFSGLGWTGSLLSPSCPVQLSDVPCMVDTIAQVEANVGINKANAYLERQLTDTIELSPTQARHQRQMVFTNTATSNAWPKGTYKNYIRLYVPATAQLQRVLIDGTPLPPTQTIVKTDGNRQVFSFLIEVPIQKSITVLAEYTVPLTTTATPFSYTFFNQQQPGIENTPINVIIKPESGLKPNVIAPQASLKNQAIIFDQLTTPHAFVGVKF